MRSFTLNPRVIPVLALVAVLAGCGGRIDSAAYVPSAARMPEMPTATQRRSARFKVKRRPSTRRFAWRCANRHQATPYRSFLS
jgi:hypothetical protein